MNREMKLSIIESLKADFSRCPAAFLVEIKGLTVGQIQSLRGAVRKEGGRVCVAKNTFARIATDGLSGIKELQPYFKNQVALVFADKEASAVAKALCGYGKDNAKFAIVAGCLDSRVIDESMVKFLGSLPPREVVIAQTCGALKAPITAHVSVLNQLMLRLVSVVKQASQKGQ